VPSVEEMCNFKACTHSAYERSGNGAERAENRLSGNGAVSGAHRKRWSVSMLCSLSDCIATDADMNIHDTFVSDPILNEIGRKCITCLVIIT